MLGKLISVPKMLPLPHSPSQTSSGFGPDVHELHEQPSPSALVARQLRKSQESRLVEQGLAVQGGFHARVVDGGTAGVLPPSRVLFPAGLHDGNITDVRAQVSGAMVEDCKEGSRWDEAGVEKRDVQTYRQTDRQRKKTG